MPSPIILNLVVKQFVEHLLFEVTGGKERYWKSKRDWFTSLFAQAYEKQLLSWMLRVDISKTEKALVRFMLQKLHTGNVGMLGLTGVALLVRLCKKQLCFFLVTKIILVNSQVYFAFAFKDSCSG